MVECFLVAYARVKFKATHFLRNINATGFDWGVVVRGRELAWLEQAFALTSVRL
jgi:hypothetical protein